MAARYERRPINSALADAFDTDDDESDDEADDRQRLVRGNSSPVNGSGSSGGELSRPTTGERQVTQLPTFTGVSSSNAAAGSAHTTTATSGRVYGSGIGTDGVFSNLAAKPERNAGEKEELPPTYEQAAADAAPPYWETTILAPGLGGSDEVYIDGMPVGSVFSFVWNGMISMSFQLVGFLLTYLLHSTHAAKNGSRAGLGITLIQYGFYMKGGSDGSSTGGGGGGGAASPGDGYATPPDPNSHDFDPNTVNDDGNGSGGGGMGSLGDSDWVAYILMIVGWFILIRALSDYFKARRHEQLVLQSPDRGLGIPIIAEGERKIIIFSVASDIDCILEKRTSIFEIGLFEIGLVQDQTITVTMAWRSTGKTNTELIENLCRNKMIHDPRVKAAFLKVDRAHYAPRSPYEDSPQPIGHHATISAPHMHAMAVEKLLDLLVPRAGRPAPRVLDIGSGSGYLTHVMAELVGDHGGLVVGVEHIAALRDLGEHNMAKSADGRAFLESGRARFRVGDGRKGWAEPESPLQNREEMTTGEMQEGGGGLWDAIHVGASAREVHPELLAQLRAPGRMFIPVDDDGVDPLDRNQHIWCVDKKEDGKVERKKLVAVRYVPLTDAPTV
ncbi:hypothetical protein B0T17DRAFT_593730 [Bombardia bombarda]|uniref:Metal homeostatis protein bsd2 n=1 Tax=Bombardia bombarda TaxID=252184 RepID=A0AA39W9V4_9PEZI|nr:hypothetical protein B0T17DRAFT_593730 [Bombardia bombarda]